LTVTKLIVTTERLRGRLVDIEVGRVPEVGYVAVGVVAMGLPHEVGLRFEARGAAADEARRNLQLEIEAYFS
jgi:hypothetical protein